MKLGISLFSLQTFFLLAGALVNNSNLGGDYLDFWILLIFCSVSFTTIVYLKKKYPLQTTTAWPEKKIFPYILAITTVFISLQLFVTSGIPLLADDPDVARIKFMTSTFGYKYYANFLPFVIVYFLSCIIYSKRRGVIYYLLLAMLLVVYSMSGQKAGLVVCLLTCLLATEVSGIDIKYKHLAIFFLILLIPLSFIFYIVAGTNDIFSGAGLIGERVTGIAEYGLYAAVHLKDPPLESTDVFINLDFLYKKILYGGTQFSPSLGRLITARVSGGDLFDSLWELTPTLAADIFVLGGWPLVIIMGIAYPAYAYWLMRKAYAERSIFWKSFFTYLFFLAFLDFMLGSYFARLTVVTLPFLLFFVMTWIARLFTNAYVDFIRRPLLARRNNLPPHNKAYP